MCVQQNIIQSFFFQHIIFMIVIWLRYFPFDPPSSSPPTIVYYIARIVYSLNSSNKAILLLLKYILIL